MQSYSFVVLVGLIVIPIMSIGQPIKLILHKPTKNLIKFLNNEELVYANTDTSASYKIKASQKNNGNYVIKKYTLDYPNYLFWRYKNGQITYNRYKEIVNLYRIDDKKIYKTRQINSEIKVLVYQNNEGVKSYYFDTNNDNDFTKEKMYSKEDFSKNFFIKISNIETYIENKIVKNSILISITEDNCDTSNLSDFEKKWQVCFRIKPFKYANLNLNNNNIKIICTYDTDYGTEFKKERTKFIFLTSYNKNEYVHYRFYDTIFIGDKKITIDSIDKRGQFLNLILSANKNRIEFGFNEGQKIPNKKLIYIDSTYAELYDYKNKFIFLNFWGTWCNPCHHLYPRIDSLKNLINNSTFKNEVIFISVARENENSLETYETFVKEKFSDWKNILIIERKENDLIDMLNINAYPTVILINPDKKILYRTTGLNNFYIVEKGINKLISSVK